MTRRLATLLGSSVPVFEAVTTLYEQELPGELKNVLGRIRERLAEGTGPGQGLAAEPHVFTESYVSMVAAGEASGALDVVLERLAEFQEDQDAVRSKVVTSLAYPILMVIVGTGVMIFLLAFVIPKIVDGVRKQQGRPAPDHRDPDQDQHAACARGGGRSDPCRCRRLWLPAAEAAGRGPALRRTGSYSASPWSVRSGSA